MIEAFPSRITRVTAALAALGLLCAATPLAQADTGKPSGAGEDAGASGDFLRPLDPFLGKHCLECHDDLTAEADLDLTELGGDLGEPGDFATWEKIFQRVRDGEMPPEKKPRPGTEDRKAFLAHLDESLGEADRGLIAEEGRVKGRRLTRVEYENSLHDLLGIDIPLRDHLPADEAEHGFATEASGQQLSHFHLEKYLNAADAALAEAFARIRSKDGKYDKTFGPKELTKRGRGNYRGPEARDGKVRMWRMLLQFTGKMYATTAPESGWYRITMKDVQGINRGDDGVVWGSLRSGFCASNAPMLHYIGSVEAAGKPRDVSFDAWMEKGHMLEFKPNEGHEKPAPTGASGGNVSFEGRDLAKKGYAGISFSAIRMQRIHPGGKAWEVRKRLLPGVEFEKGGPALEKPEAELRRLVGGFARRAFSRPVDRETLKPYLALAEEELVDGGDFLKALETGYRAVLCSPRFLAFVEAPGELDGFALAKRLGYFLWGSLPDRELQQLAEKGELGKDKVLAAQVERMLKDPKAERFVASFTDQWLRLDEIDFTTPDSKRFREFDPILQDSMVRETRAFFAELLREDLSVTNFIASDFGMLDTRLAKHYGMEGDVDIAPGEGIQRIKLPGDVRSGLVTQASLLKVTADGSTTSPVLRGVFVNERFLGVETPPPPPGTPAVEPDIRGATSIRDLLAKHSNDESCASCHVKIDPPGFALENFDPVGQWRSKYGSGKKAAKVDPSGVTPDGEKFSGIGEWKRHQLARPERLARAFAEQLTAYATGAAPRFSDHKELDRVVEEAKKEGYGVRSLVKGVVGSRMFRWK